VPRSSPPIGTRLCQNNSVEFGVASSAHDIGPYWLSLVVVNVGPPKRKRCISALASLVNQQHTEACGARTRVSSASFLHSGVVGKASCGGKQGWVCRSKAASSEINNDERTNDRPNDRTTERTNDRTNERTNERTTERRTTNDERRTNNERQHNEIAERTNDERTNERTTMLQHQHPTLWYSQFIILRRLPIFTITLM